MTTPWCLWCKHTSHKHLPPTRKETHKAPRHGGRPTVRTQATQPSWKLSRTLQLWNSKCAPLEPCLYKTFFGSFYVITMKAGTPKRKHSSFSLEVTKIKCYYLFTSVQLNVWSEGDNSFRRCILFHPNWTIHIIKWFYHHSYGRVL